MKKIRVIGAGISGSEVCYQLLKRNYLVELFEVKSIKKNAIQTNDLFANLAYSDSFHSNEITKCQRGAKTRNETTRFIYNQSCRLR